MAEQKKRQVKIKRPDGTIVEFGAQKTRQTAHGAQRAKADAGASTTETKAETPAPSASKGAIAGVITGAVLLLGGLASAIALAGRRRTNPAGTA